MAIDDTENAQTAVTLPDLRRFLSPSPHEVRRAMFSSMAQTALENSIRHVTAHLARGNDDKDPLWDVLVAALEAEVDHLQKNILIGKPAA